MPKFFTDLENIDLENKVIALLKEDVNHIKNVLRASEGDSVIVCDGLGYDYISRISKIEKDSVELTFSERVRCDNEPVYPVTLYQGIAKGERMEQLIQKCVELGINDIVPVVCRRTVVKFGGEQDMAVKTKRWQKIASEAAKQCMRGIVPKIHSPVTFKEAVEASRCSAIRFIPYEEEKYFNLKDFLENIPGDLLLGGTSFFIGPEGGFDPEEVNFAIENGIKSVSLGKRILRTETAGPAVLAILRYKFGD